jgi:ATP-binding cassette subfamily B protein
VITLDGVPVQELATSELRDAVAYAFDQPALLGATVHDALAYGRTDLDRSDVTAAAQAARADGFIRRLPLGYRTPLVRAPMSGGERQRLGLARALARPAAVYVLDDATSGLDTVTEAEVVEALTARLDGRTRLVVAHRATTAARCDLVAWLDDGQIRAVGPHVRLWADPDYRAVFGEQPAALGVAAHA